MAYKKVRLITAFVFLSFLQTCYSRRRLRPDLGSLTFSFGSDEHEFRSKEHKFREELTTAHIHVKTDTAGLIGGKWINIYTMNTSSIDNVATMASELGISQIGVFRPEISVVSVNLPLASVEHEFLLKLKEADIPVLWKHKQPTEYPRDQDYIVVASLQSQVEAIAKDLGITEYSKPKYVAVTFTLGLNKKEFLQKLSTAGINVKASIRTSMKPVMVKDVLVDVRDIPHIGAIAPSLNISNTVYNMTTFSAVSVAFSFGSDENQFHKRLNEAHISFEVNEGDMKEQPKINEYIVKTNLILKVQHIAAKLGLDVS